MILTVTMNPSVDVSYQLDTLKIDDVNRVDTVSKTAGGKGLNVSRVIKQLEQPLIATGVIGGHLGNFIIDQLQREDIPADFLTIDQESRNCIAILHESDQTEILESGPVLNPAQAAAFMDKFKPLLSDCSLVTMSGSLPKGLPSNFYASLISLCDSQNIPVALDCSGDALKQTLSSDIKPFMIKPNVTELADLLNYPVPPTTSALIEALSEPLFDGVQWIIVSLGADGAFVKHGDSFYTADIPEIEVRNPVGSGDATVAGFASAYTQGQSVKEIIQTSMTTGMLNAAELVTGYINKDNFNTYYEKIVVTSPDKQ